jgi:acetyl-CoA carboxylase carboxyltransferase component
MAEAAHHAIEAQLPLVVTIASSGADVTEGLAASFGWGLAARAITACSGVVPVLMAAHGPAVSGPALLLGLADQVVMTTDAYAFVSGPQMVHQITDVVVDTDELGGAGVHASLTGLAALVVPDLDAALDSIGALLSFLPPHVDELPPRLATDDPPDRSTPELRDLIPAVSTGSYDVRTAIAAIVDDGDLLELRAGWAPNLVTALATVDGYAVGVVANQPQAVAGTLDIPASQKGARFVSFCDAFNLPLLTLVDTSGFYPGKDLEWRGMIRHGAELVHAYAAATVPRLCLVLRKAYGGAYIVMDSRELGNDACFAWPGAEIAVMGSKGAVQILFGKTLAAIDDAEVREQERVALETDYDTRFCSPSEAAERGLVDDVIDPHDTRRVLGAALAVQARKRETSVARKHSISPL